MLPSWSQEAFSQGQINSYLRPIQYPLGCIPIASPPVPAPYPSDRCKLNWSKMQELSNVLKNCGCLVLKHPEKTPTCTVFPRSDSATVWCNIWSKLRIFGNAHNTQPTSWDELHDWSCFPPDFPSFSVTVVHNFTHFSFFFSLVLNSPIFLQLIDFLSFCFVDNILIYFENQ